MGENLGAKIMAAVAILPICAVCILGPLAIGSLFGGALGWLGGFGALATVALMIAAGGLAYREILRRRTRTPPDRKVSSDDVSHAAQIRVGRSVIPDSRNHAASDRAPKPSHSTLG